MTKRDGRASRSKLSLETLFVRILDEGLDRWPLEVVNTSKMSQYYLGREQLRRCG